jgi:HSP20 family protein
MRDLVPSSFWRMPSFFDDEDWPMISQNPSGLSVSEDENKVYVEAQIPGINPENIEVTFEEGVLWIHGDTKTEENQERKYYRRASNSFSYRISVPADVDRNTDPEAVYKNGVMTVTFPKFPKKQPKKIAVKTA